VEQRVAASNGINIYYYKQPNTHSICISLYIKAGTLYENGYSGITHFLEHLHFRRLGGRTQKELYHQLECVGGYFGASTYKEFMQFYLTSSPKYFSDLARIASDLLGSLEANLNDFYAEKRLVLSEIREDHQKDDIDFISNKYIWGNTNLKNPILGNASSIGTFTLQLLQAEKEKTFAKQNMFFYVSGNFSDSDISRLANDVERYNLDNRPNTRNSNIAQIPDSFRNRNAFVKISQRKFYMHDVKISLDVDFNKISRHRLLYLDGILSEGLSSLLREELIEKKGLIYSFSSTIEQYANIGTYYFKFEVHKNKLLETIKSFVSVVKEVKKGISEADMQTVRVFKTDNQKELLDDPENLNWTLAYENHILDNNYMDMSELADAYEQIDKGQLTMVANEIFKANNILLISIGNKKGLSENKLHDILSEL